MEMSTAKESDRLLYSAISSLSEEISCTDIVDNGAVEKILTMIDEGGKDLLITSPESLLYRSIHMKAPVEIINKLIEVGGKELVMKKNLDFDTSLHIAFESNAVVDVVTKLIEVGGKELLIAKDCYGYTVLHYACSTPTSLEIIKMMIDLGGRDLLEQMNDENGLIVVNLVLAESRALDDDKIIETLILLIKEGIYHNIYDDEFSIGGLLHHDYMKDDIFEFWFSLVSPALKEVYRLIKTESPNKTPPLLHSMIMIKAPKFVILDLLYNFDGMVSMKDTKGRYAIDVAIEMNLPFDEGMREILEATAMTNGCNILDCAAARGLPWSNGMEELVSENRNDAVNGVNEETGLKLFMTAAIGGSLDTIYSLTQMHPMSMFYI